VTLCDDLISNVELVGDDNKAIKTKMKNISLNDNEAIKGDVEEREEKTIGRVILIVIV